MRRLRALLSQPTTWVRIHGLLAVAWVILAIPGILWWRNSVPFLVGISIYANFAGSVASWQSAKADRNSVDCADFDRVEAKIDAVRKVLYKKK